MRALVGLVLAVQILGPTKERDTREGNERYAEGKLDQALERYTQAQVDHPDAPELHYNIGNVQYRKKDFEKALEEYRVTLPERSEVARRASFNAGNVHYQGQKWEDAIKAYTDALRIDPSDVEARQNLELALQKRKEEQEQQPKQPEGGGGGSSGGDDEETDSEKAPEEKDQEPQGQSPKPEESTADQSSADAEPSGMSPEEAERILQALAQIEQAQQLEQQQKQKATARGKGKYW